MQAYELTTKIDEQGNLQLPSDCKPAFGRQARVIVLVDDAQPTPTPEQPAAPVPTLAQFSGLLKDSPSFDGDPVAIQRELRDEWR